MSGRVTIPMLHTLAAVERERLTEFLTAVEAVRDARDFWDSLPEEPQTMAEEHMEARALDQQLELEESLLALALDPDLVRFLGMVLKEMDGIAEGRP